MLRFMLGRIGQALVVVFVVTIIVFLLLHALPGGPARGVLGVQATPEQIALFNTAQGLDKPLVVQYIDYLGRLLQGDLGTSYVLNASVSDMLVQRLPKTLLLSVLSAAVGLAIAIPVGLWQASRRGKPSDYVLTALSFVAYATPVFFLGLVLIVVFSQVLPILPSQAPQGDTIWQILGDPAALILPVAAGSLGMVAVFSRYMRSSTLDNLSEDYVRTALAKGTPMRKVLQRHVFRNSLTAITTMLGYYIPVLFGGALVVEQLFNFPGMGLLFWSAAQAPDFPILLGCVLVISIATVVGSLLADLAQVLIDPRVKEAR
ncbi:ABC transporter permease [Saxibacter everestensis]|uniref:ABC transporter permease n=1 Tax=Saxibacter everestensis TaxID=2909229 RepID=A0ABY8R105_9MICO|nr:ABC transporter permease [Brevibacteriaceae bacterium ZFBP1038]